MPLLQPNVPSSLNILMTSGTVGGDIKQYVECWLGQYERLRDLPARLKDDIRFELLSRSDGVWVFCTA